MTPDRDLLRHYVRQRDEAAFTELVRRHLNLVYGTVLRQVNGEAVLAEDITQATFAELVRQAPQLCDHATLAGWLHATARFQALRSVRGEQRRRAREQEAATMSNQNTSVEVSWEQLRPLLDEAVAQLDEPDRNAILLRFFEEKTHSEVGAILGLSENTARMRTERALEKLRDHFARAGVTTTAALLAATLNVHGATSAPATLAASVVEKLFAVQTVAGAAGGDTVLVGESFMKNSTKTILAAGVLAGIIALGIYFHSPYVPTSNALNPSKSVRSSVVFNPSRPPVPPAVPPPQVTYQPHPPQSLAQIAPAPAPSINGVALSDQQKSDISNNLRQFFAAAEVYMLQIHPGATSANYYDLVGDTTDKQFHASFTPAAAENYTGLVVTQTQTDITVATPSGENVTVEFGISVLDPVGNEPDP